MVFRNPESIHSPLASYSHQAEICNTAKWLIISAQIGMDKNGFIPEDVISQIEIAFDNITQNLKAANMEKNDLVKLVFYFVGSHDVEQRRNIVRRLLGEHKPCMTVIYVAGLATEALKVEIDAWACKV